MAYFLESESKRLPGHSAAVGMDVVERIYGHGILF
jgi:hypothetical protein